MIAQAVVNPSTLDIYKLQYIFYNSAIPDYVASLNEVYSKCM